MQRIKITQARIIDPVNAVDATGDIYIADKKIIAILQTPQDFDAELEIDARGLVACPGFVDLSCRLREPGFSQKADISSELRAAASAGFTSVCVPPDTRPVIDSTAVVELIRDKALCSASYSQVYPIGALSRGLQGKELSSMFALKQAGCIAVSNAQQPLNNLLVLQRAMQYAASHDLLVIYQPFEHALGNMGCAHDGHVATRYGLPGIPESAETIAVAQCLELVQQNACRVHFSQLSSARSVTLLQHAKDNGLPVSADVAMHQLHLCEDDMVPFDSMYHVKPPLRSAEDRIVLQQALKQGIIDAVCSDHQPHDIDAKLGAFPETAAGISALETMLPLMLKLVDENMLSLSQGIQVMSANPATILGLDCDTLQVGSVADVCLFNPTQSWRIDEQHWLSRGQNTPFWGQDVMGKVTHTIQAGKLIYQQ